jgi:hypothetical protein
MDTIIKISIYFNDFTKINYHKVKLQLIFNPAEQSILTVRINDL